MWVIYMTHLKFPLNLEFDYRNFQIFAWITRSNFKNFDLTELRMKNAI